MQRARQRHMRRALVVLMALLGCARGGGGVRAAVPEEGRAAGHMVLAQQATLAFHSHYLSAATSPTIQLVPRAGGAGCVRDLPCWA